jgi:hypothetical protein
MTIQQRVAVLTSIIGQPVKGSVAIKFNTEKGQWEVFARIPNADGLGSKVGRVWQTESVDEAVSVERILDA